MVFLAGAGMGVVSGGVTVLSFRGIRSLSRDRVPSKSLRSVVFLRSVFKMDFYELVANRSFP